MPDSDRISIDNLTLAPDLSNNDVAPVVHTVNGVKSTYKATMTLLGTFLNKVLQYSADLTTSNKTIIGAINEINTGGGGGGAVILYGTSAPASSLGSDGNLYVQYTAGTGGASDVVDALYVKLDDEWCEISTGGGSGISGHVIVDEDGTSLTQRANLQFNGAYLEDNSVDDTTEVNVVREMTKAQFNQLTADEKTGLINISDESLNATEIPITDGSQTNTKSYIDNGLNDKVDTTDFDATNLPIESGSATNTKSYIDSKTPINNGEHATDLSTTGLTTGTYLYKYDNTTNGIPQAGTEGDCYITINNAQPYGCELAVSNSGLYWRNKVNQVWGNWLDISGLLSVHSGISASPVDVNGTFQIPDNVLKHNLIVITFRRFGYAATVVATRSGITGGNYGTQFTRAIVSGSMYWDTKIDNNGLITLLAKGDTTVPYIEVFGYL